MMEHVRTMGAQFGITFTDRPFLSNSHRALQAAEFARENDRFSQFHSALFTAYFSKGLDIGDLAVLSQIGHGAGLDIDAMIGSIRSGKYLPKLTESQQEAARFGVTGVPSFLIGGKRLIVGAQSLEVFRRVLISA